MASACTIFIGEARATRNGRLHLPRRRDSLSCDSLHHVVGPMGSAIASSLGGGSNMPRHMQVANRGSSGSNETHMQVVERR